MPQMQVSETDLEKAKGQVALLKEMLVDYSLNPEANAEIIAKIESDIKENEEDARTFDQILNPRPRPEKCRLCNGHPKVDMATKPCPECGVDLVMAQPPSGVTHWKVPGQAKGVALPHGEVAV